MVLVGCRLSATEHQALLDDPTGVDVLIWGDEVEEEEDLQEPELDLDKSWHGIHYLLTGTAWTISDGAGSAILGGEEVGEDNGYGPARILASDEVHTIAASLDAVDVEVLRARFDPGTMDHEDIYPQLWTEVSFDYLESYFIELRNFYRRAADDNQAVLLAIT